MSQNYSNVLSHTFRNYLRAVCLEPTVKSNNRTAPASGDTLYMQEPYNNTCGPFSIIAVDCVVSKQVGKEILYHCTVLLNKPSVALFDWLKRYEQTTSLLNIPCDYEPSMHLAPVILTPNCTDPNWFVVTDLRQKMNMTNEILHGII